MKKLVSLLLAALMCLAALFAFAAEDTVAYTETGAKVIHYGEQIELKIPVYERAGAADPIDNNFWTRWIQTNFGDKYNIKVTFIPIPRNDEVTKFTMLMAGGAETATDMIFHYDNPQIRAYIDEGYVMELDEAMVAEYMPDYLNYVGEYAYNYGKIVVDGELKQMMLPAARDKTDNWANCIRKDWLDAVNMDMPTSTEEYIEVLKAFKEAKLGGENTIPATQQLPSTTGTRADSFREGHTSEREIAIYSDLNVVALPWEPLKENLQFLNTLYNEGLISPEFALDTDGTQAKADFVNGVAGVYGFYLASNSDVIATLKENCPEAELAILSPLANTPEGYTCYDYTADLVGISSGVTIYCKHPEAVMMYINWMATPEILNTLQYGFEGKNYTVDANTGLRVLNSNYDGEERFASTNANTDLFLLVAQNRRDSTSVEAMAATYCPIGYEHLIYQVYAANDLKTYIHNYRFSGAIASQSEYQATLKEMFQSMSVELIMCPSADFDALYEQRAQEYMDAGYEEIITEKAAAYDADHAE